MAQWLDRRLQTSKVSWAEDKETAAAGGGGVVWTWGLLKDQLKRASDGASCEAS